MISMILITIITFLITFILVERNNVLFLISALFFTLSFCISANLILSFFVGAEVNTDIYEPVSIIQTTETGVVEIIEDTYYKDENSEYYIVSEELPNFKDHLWNPIVYAEMEKVDYPVLEYQGELNE